ncbi:MAG: thiolase family protein [Nitrospinota bacterium]|nr:thiolase family protein [Nitrospinota bacterium]
MSTEEVVILSSVRTPVGSFGGSLKDITAPELGVLVSKEAIRRSNVQLENFDEVIFGHGWQAGVGPNSARLISVRSGLSEDIPAFTVNKRCGSSLKTVSLAAQSIRAGDSSIVLAGGVESTSNVPYIQEDARWGARIGHAKFLDLIYQDGYMDPLSGQLMGCTAENLVEKYNISREEQDEFALESQEKATKAIETGLFEDEIVNVELKNRKGEIENFTKDETPHFNISLDKLSKLRPVFEKEGSVTAGNSCCQGDAGSALVLSSKERASELGLKPLVSILGYASAGVDPKLMGLGPVEAIPMALQKANRKLEDMDLIEVNEAFAAQVIACERELRWDRSKLNVRGGAIALGHPVGATGGKILATCMNTLEKIGKEHAVVSACIGGGQGIALVVQRIG